MSKSSIGRRRAGISSLATTALVLGAAVTGAGAASADATFAFERIGGADRYETAALVSDAYGDSADVILANGEPGHFPDALVANYLAGVNGSPILLTRADNLPQYTEDQLVDSGAENITIVGGTGVVSAAQEAGLVADGYTVDRVFGADRYATNAAVINEAGAAASSTAIVTTGVDFPDALGAGPLAYHEGMPLAITNATNINDAVVDALVDSGVSEFVVLGGETIVGPTVIAELEAAGIDFDQRIYGADRAATSVELANYAIDTLNFVNTGINVASGYIAGTGADALAGGPLTGEQIRPLLITRNVDVPGASVLDFLEENANTLTEGIIFGGNAAVSVDAEAQMEAAAQSVTTNQDFTVTPAGATSTSTSTSGNDEGAVTLAFSGVTGDNLVVALFPCGDVTTDGNGVTTFADAEATGAGSSEADNIGTTEQSQAVIEQINGSAPDIGGGGTFDDTVSAVNGNVNVVVDSEEFDCATVVLFSDTDNDGQLDLDANNQPTEPFVVGGPVTFTPAEAANGTYFNGTVLAVNEAENYFILDNGINGTQLFRYDSADTFYYGGSFAVSMAEWELALNTGDYIWYWDQAYSRTGPNEFDLNSDYPLAPENLQASVGDFDNVTDDLLTTDVNEATAANDARFTWTAADEALIENYTVEVYEDDANANTACDIGGVPVTQETTVGDETTVDVENLGDDTYCAVVYATSQTNDDSDNSASAAFTIQVAPVDAVAPVINKVELTTDGGTTGVIGDGDTITFGFSEAMATATATGSFRFSDPDGEIFQISCTTLGVSCTLIATDLNNDGDTIDAGEADSGMTVGLVGTAPVKVGGSAGDSFAQVPGTITAVSTVWDDLAGNQLNLAGSPDKEIDIPLG